MENVKDTISKKKTMKHVLCYFGLVILTILLFVPLVFKIVFKEEGEQKKKDVIIKLVCDKEGEKVESSFVNDDPKHITYTIVGDHTNNTQNPDTPSTTTTQAAVTTASTPQPQTGENQATDVEQVNPVMKLLLNYGTMSYDETINMTSIKFNIAVTANTKDYELIFDTIAHQDEYFRAQGFVCTKNTIAS